jgi:type II secretory pathway component PulF
MRHKSVTGLKRQLAMPIGGGFMLILMSLGVMIFMLPVVMGPVIAKNPDSLTEFPLIIRAYWGASVWLRNNYTLTAIVVSMPIWLFIFRNTRLLAPWIERGLMGTAPIRRIILSFNGVMIVYFMPTLVRSGMPLPQVLLALAASLKTTEVVVALKRAAYEHEHGRRLGDSLATLPLRGSFRTAVEAGEKTGKVADRVEDLKVPYVSEFERIVRKAVALLMITVMAGLLPFFIISMYTSLVAPMIALMEYS